MEVLPVVIVAVVVKTVCIRVVVLLMFLLVLPLTCHNCHFNLMGAAVAQNKLTGLYEESGCIADPRDH